MANDENTELIQRNLSPGVYESAEEPIQTNDETLNQDNSNIKTKFYSSYLCKRSYRFHINSRILFYFQFENDNIFYAKSRGPGTNSVYISSTKSIHIKSEQYEYVLFQVNHSKKFILKEKNSEDELMVITMDNDYGVEYGPRKINIFWPKDNLTHVSRIPKRNSKGEWTLNFGSKFVISSTKNAIILDENSKPSLIIRKIEKNVLQTEIIRQYKPIYIFAFSIASFLCTF